MIQKLVKTTDAKTGELVTAIYPYSIGVAYIYEGDVWEASGSLWATPARDSVFPLYGILRDGGDFYKNAIKQGNFKVPQEAFDNSLMQLFWLEG